ncbi:MAG: alpha/beta hydrolase [Acidobacteriota bacterium]
MAVDFRTPPARLLLALALLLLVGGCKTLERLAVRAAFQIAELPPEREVQDIAYRQGEGADELKHRLDLFLPAPAAAQSRGWPTLIFVHGGSWNSGDRDLTFGGEEIYGNIGRFYANRGLGVAVISYRLQPGVTWFQQVDDVAAAAGWVSRNIADYGGDPGSIFVSGHSAGAQLGSYAVAAREPLERHGVDPRAICGVISVSGAGLDVADEKTYELGADREFYDRTFGPRAAEPEGWNPGTEADGWRRRASAVSFLAEADGAPPPWLGFYAGPAHPLVGRQAELLRRAVAAAGGEAEVLEIPKLSHRRIVAEFSQPGGGLDAPLLAFVEAHRDCRRRPEGSRPAA